MSHLFGLEFSSGFPDPIFPRGSTFPMTSGEPIAMESAPDEVRVFMLTLAAPLSIWESAAENFYDEGKQLNVDSDGNQQIVDLPLKTVRNQLTSAGKDKDGNVIYKHDDIKRQMDPNKDQGYGNRRDRN